MYPGTKIQLYCIFQKVISIYLLDKEVNCAELQLKEVELENLKSF